jgi:hypothetical protein
MNNFFTCPFKVVPYPQGTILAAGERDGKSREKWGKIAQRL